MKCSIIFVICMISCCNCKLEDYRLSPLSNRALRSVFGNDGGSAEITTAAPPKFACSTAGLQCSDCETVVNCLDMGESFLEIITSKCASGETCNNGTCSKEANHQCGGLSKIGFKCTAVGMFPNPADCQKFYICAPKSPGQFDMYEGQCGKDRAYDMTTTYCGLKMGANKQCPLTTVVPTCDKPGSTFVLSNKSIFGMCVIETAGTPPVAYLVPRLYLCPNGGAYTPATYKCT